MKPVTVRPVACAALLACGLLGCINEPPPIALPGADPFTRVVTVIDADGHSRIESAGPPPIVFHPRHAEQVLTSIWNVSSTPATYGAPGDPERFRLHPEPRGVRIIRNKLPPDTLMYVGEDGTTRVPRPDESMHRTRTIDFIQVLTGELWLILESGEEVRLAGGDCVVQRGTVHAWRNRSDAPVTFVAVLIDADEGSLPATPRGAEPVRDEAGESAAH